MSQPLTITECLLDQCRRYPALEPQDLIKALHQSVYGCGHLVGAAEEGVGRIREEMESARGMRPERRCLPVHIAGCPLPGPGSWA